MMWFLPILRLCVELLSACYPFLLWYLHIRLGQWSFWEYDVLSRILKSFFLVSYLSSWLLRAVRSNDSRFFSSTWLILYIRAFLPILLAVDIAFLPSTIPLWRRINILQPSRAFSFTPFVFVSIISHKIFFHLIMRLNVAIQTSTFPCSRLINVLPWCCCTFVEGCFISTLGSIRLRSGMPMILFSHAFRSVSRWMFASFDESVAFCPDCGSPVPTISILVGIARYKMSFRKSFKLLNAPLSSSACSIHALCFDNWWAVFCVWPITPVKRRSWIMAQSLYFSGHSQRVFFPLAAPLMAMGCWPVATQLHSHCSYCNYFRAVFLSFSSQTCHRPQMQAWHDLFRPLFSLFSAVRRSRCSHWASPRW